MCSALPEAQVLVLNPGVSNTNIRTAVHNITIQPQLSWAAAIVAHKEQCLALWERMACRKLLSHSAKLVAFCNEDCYSYYFTRVIDCTTLCV